MDIPKHAKFLRVTGTAILLLGSLTFACAKPAVMRYLGLGLGNGTSIKAGGLALVAVGWQLLSRGKKLIMKSADTVMREDSRPPIVYLRSFQFDEILSRRILGIDSPIRTTQEEDLVEALGDLGPVVAIGKPGEILPTLGAARAYVPDSDWQAEVRHLLGKANLVVLVIGATPGLLWEVGTIIELNRPESLVFVVPNSRNEYVGFAELAHHLLRKPLPSPELVFAKTRLLQKLSGVQLRGAIYFEPDWTPKFSEFRLLRWAYWRDVKAGDTGASTSMVRGGLSPVYSRLLKPRSH